MKDTNTHTKERRHYTTVDMSINELKYIETLDKFVADLKKIEGYDFIIKANILVKNEE